MPKHYTTEKKTETDHGSIPTGETEGRVTPLVESSAEASAEKRRGSSPSEDPSNEGSKEPAPVGLDPASRMLSLSLELLNMDDEENTAPEPNLHVHMPTDWATETQDDSLLQPSAKRARLGPSEHPFAECYAERTPASKSSWLPQRLIDMEQLSLIQDFRTHTLGKIDKEETPVDSESPEEGRADPVWATTRPANVPASVYVAATKNGRQWILIPEFVEVVGDDRPDLAALDLAESCKDALTGSQIDMATVHQGSAFFVTDLIRSPTCSPSEARTISAVDATLPSSRRFWRVTQVHRLQDKRLNSVIGTKLRNHARGSRAAYAVDGLTELAFTTPRLPKSTRDDFELVDVVIGPGRPGRFLPSLAPSAHAFVTESTDAYRPRLRVHPTVIATRPLRQDQAEALQRSPRPFASGIPDQEALAELFAAVRFGASAVAQLAGSRQDSATYCARIRSSRLDDSGIILVCSFGSPARSPKLVDWPAGTEVSINIASETCRTLTARLVTVKMMDGGSMETSVRLAARHVPTDAWSNWPGRKATLWQVQSSDEQAPQGSMEDPVIPPPSPENRAIRALIAAHGGSPLPDVPPQVHYIGRLQTGRVDWTQEQSRLKGVFQEATIDAAAFSCPPGTGKTSALTAAILETLSTSGDIVVVLSAANAAVHRCLQALDELDPLGLVRAVRIISQSNRDRIDPSLRSERDLPALRIEVLRQCVAECDAAEPSPLQASAYRHLIRENAIDPEKVSNAALRAMTKMSWKKTPPAHSLAETFWSLFRPQVIYGTTATVTSFFSIKAEVTEALRKSVVIVATDEASTAPRQLFLRTALTFPTARTIWVGDERQLAPYEEAGMPEKLAEFAVGSPFKEIVDSKAWPVFSLTKGFRCPAETSDLVSRLSYGGILKSGRPRKASYPELALLHLPDGHPIVYMETRGQADKEGTSLANKAEAKIAAEVAKRWRNSTAAGGSLAILCVYKAQQASLLHLAGGSVSVDSVDSSQGKEYDMVLICTTRTSKPKNGDFTDDPRRVNVALSRSRGPTILLANAEYARHTIHWAAVQKAVPASSHVDAAVFLKSQSS